MTGFTFLAILLVAIVVLVAVILIRTALFNPYPEPGTVEEKVTLNEEKIIKDMSDMIRCRTVSYQDKSLIDWKEFEKFQTLLQERFPNVHKAFSLEKIGDTGLLYHMQGKKSDAPRVLMSHYDVVPVEEKDWDKPAFDGLVE